SSDVCSSDLEWLPSVNIFTGKNRHGSGRALNGLCLSGGGDHHAGQFQLFTLRERRIGLGLAGNRAEQQRKGRNFLHEFLKSEIRKLLRRAGAEKPRATAGSPDGAALRNTSHASFRTGLRTHDAY